MNEGMTADVVERERERELCGRAFGQYLCVLGALVGVPGRRSFT